MSPRIAIVGSGLAGLAAAWRLRARGAEVVVLERAERAGGRAGSDRREGFCFDAGAQLVGARDRALLALIHEAGLAESLLPIRPVAPALARAGGRVPVDLAGLRGLLRVPGLGVRSALRTLRLDRLLERFSGILRLDAPEAGARLDDRSVADFVRLYLGPRALDALAAPFCAELGTAPEQASRLLFVLHWLARRHPTEGTLRDGLDRLVDALAGAGRLRLGAPVEGVAEVSQGGVALAVGGAEAGRVQADALVLAAPAHVAREIAEPLLVPAERDALARVRYAPAIVLHAALARRPARVAVRVRVPPSMESPLAALQLEPPGAAGRTPEGRAAVSLLTTPAFARAHLEAPDEVVTKALFAALDEVLPAASGAVEFVTLRRHREAWPRFEVGAFRRVAGLRRVGADRRAAGRRLYLAGDYLAFPTLEGAALSGARAADEVAADLGLGSAR